MSSVKSPTPPADAAETLRQAFTDVCENSFFALVEPCSPERFAVLVKDVAVARPGSAEWIKSSVGFTGAFAGAVEMALPAQLAETLVTQLLGEEIECAMPEHWMFDGVGEFANMVCGAWLTTMGSTQAFELRPPAVTRMNAEWSPIHDAKGDDDRSHRLVINKFPVRIRFRATGA